MVDLLKQLLQRGVVPRRQHPRGALVLSQVLGQGRVCERGLAEEARVDGGAVGVQGVGVLG